MSWQLIEHVLDLGMPAPQAVELITRMYVLEQSDHPKVLAVDLDDTLLKYVRGGGYGAPLPGMVDLLKQLRSEGWKIVIWTCRSNDERVADKLKEKGIPYDYINDNPHGKDNGDIRKIHADVYLDDKAVTANGRADAELLDKIRNFQSWSKRDREEKKRRKESIDEAHTCHAYNPNTGVCETGCMDSSVSMGARCPWDSDWERAASNPDQGGCKCYG